MVQPYFCIYIYPFLPHLAIYTRTPAHWDEGEANNYYIEDYKDYKEKSSSSPDSIVLGKIFLGKLILRPVLQLVL
jgi:hypothetical protein